VFSQYVLFYVYKCVRAAEINKLTIYYAINHQALIIMKIIIVKFPIKIKSHRKQCKVNVTLFLIVATCSFFYFLLYS